MIGIKKTWLIGCFSLFLLPTVSAQQSTNNLPYKNPNLSVDERARDLLSRMTVDEKISQMRNSSPAIERLGIPQTDWWNEALHGVARAGKATVFPQAIGLAATFDPQGVNESFTMISDEARAKHHEFKRKNSFKRYQGLTFWTPNINIFRDPRWGRGMETYGEDPYLTTTMGLAVVEGLQGDGTAKYDKTHACAKHYAVHSGPEWNRHSYDAKNISQRDLWETYLPAFHSLVVDGDVKEVMCAYNRFEGEPCCGSKELLVEILRNEWNFDNVIVSDCGAINDFYGKGKHETHPSAVEASADAVLSGTDVECGGSYAALTEAVEKGLINEAEIDKSVFRLLRARFQLGMFDPDSLVSWAQIPYSVVESKEHVAKSLEMARKSMVLLENKNGTLPLSKDMKVAVIGPNAADSVMLWANYNGFPTKSVTILEGIRSKLSPHQVIYDKGCEFVEKRVFTDKTNLCSYDGQPGVKATFWNSTDYSGDVAATMHVSDQLSFDNGGNTVFAPGVNLSDFSAIFETTYTPDASEKVTIRIMADDNCTLFLDDKEVMSTRWSNEMAPGEYVVDVEKGKPVKIMMKYYQTDRSAHMKFAIGTMKELDYEAVAQKVKDMDVIVFVGGISAKLEGEQMNVKLPGFRGGDRTDIELPEVQLNLLKALKATGKPVVFVLCSGSSMALPWESQNLDAILEAWYPGQAGGTAVADVLFGDYNPAGRLPLTFYSSTNELPDYEDYNMNKGRTYRYYEGKPIYPFGHGLSYTTFEYSTASMSQDKEAVCLNVNVKNSGKFDGEEVVQVYIRDVQDPEGPIKSLRGFQRVSIPKGESRSVSIRLPDTAFEFFDTTTQRTRVKEGNYEIYYGGSSDDLHLQKINFEFKK